MSEDKTVHADPTVVQELKETTFPVLDHGFVRFVDVFGDDARIVQAARVSYSGGTKTMREDAGLIDYLIRKRHTSPIEQVEFTFHCKMPIFVARQWVRHRTASLNEVSGRYSVLSDEVYIPDHSRMQPQSKSNKQGSEAGELDFLKSADLEDKDDISMEMERVMDESRKAYEDFVEIDLSRELSRIVLPVAQYTEWYWKMDLHNLFHFLKLRMDSHAQWEIRQYANVIAKIVQKVCPHSWVAFEKHILHSASLSKDEILALENVGLLETLQQHVKSFQTSHPDIAKSLQSVHDKLDGKLLEISKAEDKELKEEIAKVFGA